MRKKLHEYNFADKTIWLINDNDEDSKSLSELLKYFKANIRTYDLLDGIAAINTLESKRRKDFPDLIISDHNFSEGLRAGEDPFLSRRELFEMRNGGTQVVSAVQKRGLGIPVIICTNYAVLPVVPGAAAVINEDVENKLMPAIDAALFSQKRTQR